MDFLSVFTILAFIGFIIFAALSLVEIVKLGIFAFNMKKNEKIYKEDWRLKSKKGFFYYTLFILFSFAYRILNGIE
jgi:hypothetical protein